MEIEGVGETTAAMKQQLRCSIQLLVLYTTLGDGKQWKAVQEWKSSRMEDKLQPSFSVCWCLLVLHPNNTVPYTQTTQFRWQGLYEVARSL
ncbi:hypothetical protein AB6D20_027975 (plasmid) [Vibrio splendidus]